MIKSLKDKKILITAGPVWVPLDKIRIISNVFTGALGFEIAKEAAKRGSKITLLLGPGILSLPVKLPQNLKLIRFNFFDELYKLMKREISSQKYDTVIHSAAVADFIPQRYYKGKISSGKKTLLIEMKSSPKIANKIKGWSKKVFLVNFKLEVNLTKKELIKRAYKSMLVSKSDLVVANDFKDINIKKGLHKAFIIYPVRNRISNGVNEKKNVIPCRTKKEIAKKLLKAILKESNNHSPVF